MKQDHAEVPADLEDGDIRLDAENAEFDFSNAPRPGRNELYERAQGRFYEVPDADGHGTLEPRRPTSARGRHRTVHLTRD